MQGRVFLWIVFAVVALVIVLAVIFFCRHIDSEESTSQDIEWMFPSERFIVIDKTKDVENQCIEYLLYDSETLVEYLFIVDTFRAVITPLYNSDGSLILYTS